MITFTRRGGKILPITGLTIGLLLSLGSQSESQEFTRAPGQPETAGDQDTRAPTIPREESLKPAYQTASYINRLLDTIPEDQVAIRDHLHGIQAVFFISDYVMTARTNTSLTISKYEIAAAFSEAGQDASFVKDRLKLWAVRPGTLPDHYQSISAIPSEQDNVQSIKSALTATGLTINDESDLLMDCIRYVVHNTGIHEMYGATPRHLGEATYSPVILNSLVSTGDAVFHHRFTEKHGLTPAAATGLMNRLKGIRTFNLSPADVEIPVRRFE